MRRSTLIGIKCIIHYIEKEIKDIEELATLSKDVHSKVDTVTKEQYPSYGTNRTAKSSLDKTAEVNKSKKDVSSFVGKLFFSFIALYRGWRHYKEYRVALAGLALAFLYFTVLGFDNITIGKIDLYYVKDRGGVMMFNATFNKISFNFVAVTFIVGYPEKNTDPSKVTDKLLFIT